MVASYKCVAKDCTNVWKGKPPSASKDYISFHRFPQSTPPLLQAWFQNIFFDSDPPKREAIDRLRLRICSEHFEPSCFVFKKSPLGQQNRRFLTSDAVPTIFSQHADTMRVKNRLPLQKMHANNKTSADSDSFSDSQDDENAKSMVRWEKSTSDDLDAENMAAILKEGVAEVNRISEPSLASAKVKAEVKLEPLQDAVGEEIAEPALIPQATAAAAFDDFDDNWTLRLELDEGEETDEELSCDDDVIVTAAPVSMETANAEEMPAAAATEHPDSMETADADQKPVAVATEPPASSSTDRTVENIIDDVISGIVRDRSPNSPAAIAKRSERTPRCWCIICGETYSVVSIRLHIHLAHFETYRPYFCAICDSSYKDIHGFGSHHQRVHRGIQRRVLIKQDEALEATLNTFADRSKAIRSGVTYRWCSDLARHQLAHIWPKTKPKTEINTTETSTNQSSSTSSSPKVTNLANPIIPITANPVLPVSTSPTTTATTASISNSSSTAVPALQFRILSVESLAEKTPLANERDGSNVSAITQQPAVVDQPTDCTTAVEATADASVPLKAKSASSRFRAELKMRNDAGLFALNQDSFYNGARCASNGLPENTFELIQPSDVTDSSSANADLAIADVSQSDEEYSPELPLPNPPIQSTEYSNFQTRSDFENPDESNIQNAEESIESVETAMNSQRFLFPDFPSPAITSGFTAPPPGFPAAFGGGASCHPGIVAAGISPISQLPLPNLSPRPGLAAPPMLPGVNVSFLPVAFNGATYFVPVLVPSGPPQISFPRFPCLEEPPRPKYPKIAARTDAPALQPSISGNALLAYGPPQPMFPGHTLHYRSPSKQPAIAPKTATVEAGKQTGLAANVPSSAQNGPFTLFDDRLILRAMATNCCTTLPVDLRTSTDSSVASSSGASPKTACGDDEAPPVLSPFYEQTPAAELRNGSCSSHDGRSTSFDFKPQTNHGLGASKVIAPSPKIENRSSFDDVIESVVSSSHISLASSFNDQPKSSNDPHPSSPLATAHVTAVDVLPFKIDGDCAFVLPFDRACRWASTLDGRPWSHVTVSTRDRERAERRGEAIHRTAVCMGRFLCPDPNCVDGKIPSTVDLTRTYFERNGIRLTCKKCKLLGKLVGGLYVPCPALKTFVFDEAAGKVSIYHSGIHRCG